MNAMNEQAGFPDLYVMDSLANDIEDLESILRMLNSDTVLGWHKEWGREFERAEIVEALSRMIRDDMVRVYVFAAGNKVLEEAPPRSLPPASYDDVYFGLTPRGRLVHQNWEPDIEVT